MIEAIKLERTVATNPFGLLEGGYGYGLYRPAIVTAESGLNRMLPTGKLPDFALLMVRGEDLIGSWLNTHNHFRLSISMAASNPAETYRTLIESGDSGSGIHSFNKIYHINDATQPLKLVITKNIYLHSLQWFNIVGWSLIGLFLTLYTGLRLFKRHIRQLREKQEKQRLYQQANYDCLTGLPNTNLLLDRAEQALLRANRTFNNVAICYMDINHFKDVNDRWGHQAGDELLIQIAQRLTTTLREEDTIARIHGDEFVILLPNLKNLELIEQMREKILSVFDTPFNISHHPLDVTGSCGVAVYPNDGRTLEELMAASDKRMYLHKEQMNQPSPVPTDS